MPYGFNSLRDRVHYDITEYIVGELLSRDENLNIVVFSYTCSSTDAITINSRHDIIEVFDNKIVVGSPYQPMPLRFRTWYYNPDDYVDPNSNIIELISDVIDTALKIE